MTPLPTITKVTKMDTKVTSCYPGDQRVRRDDLVTLLSSFVPFVSVQVFPKAYRAPRVRT